MIDRANFLEMLNEIRRCVLAANGELGLIIFFALKMEDFLDFV